MPLFFLPGSPDDDTYPGPDLRTGPLACAVLWGHHSDDRVTVWHGSTEPATLCGRHATYATADDWARMRDRGALVGPVTDGPATR